MSRIFCCCLHENLNRSKIYINKIYWIRESNILNESAHTLVHVSSFVHSIFYTWMHECKNSTNIAKQSIRINEEEKKNIWKQLHTYKSIGEKSSPSALLIKRAIEFAAFGVQPTGAIHFYLDVQTIWTDMWLTFEALAFSYFCLHHITLRDDLKWWTQFYNGTISAFGSFTPIDKRYCIF